MNIPKNLMDGGPMRRKCVFVLWCKVAYVIYNDVTINRLSTTNDIHIEDYYSSVFTQEMVQHRARVYTNDKVYLILLKDKEKRMRRKRTKGKRKLTNKRPYAHTHKFILCVLCSVIMNTLCQKTEYQMEQWRI